MSINRGPETGTNYPGSEDGIDPKELHRRFYGELPRVDPDRSDDKAIIPFDYERRVGSIPVGDITLCVARDHIL